jgi:hypothetical protein
VQEQVVFGDLEQVLEVLHILELAPHCSIDEPHAFPGASVTMGAPGAGPAAPPTVPPWLVCSSLFCSVRHWTGICSAGCDVMICCTIFSHLCWPRRAVLSRRWGTSGAVDIDSRLYGLIKTCCGVWWNVGVYLRLWMCLENWGGCTTNPWSKSVETQKERTHSNPFSVKPNLTCLLLEPVCTHPLQTQQ